MVNIKPFSSLYYYNKYPKANNVSRFVKETFSFDDYGFSSISQNECNVKALQNFEAFDDVNENFKNWLESGVLTVSGSPAIFACEISYKIFDKTYSTRGFFAALKLPNKVQNTNNKQEDIKQTDMKEKSYIENSDFDVLNFESFDEKRTAIVSKALNHVSFQTSSVFALYDDDNDDEIESVLDEMCTTSCFEKAKHLHVSYKVWEISETSLIEKLQKACSKLTKLYLAGGREIFDAALINRQKDNSANCVLAFLTKRTSNALAVLPFHRVISMDMFDFDEVLDKLSTRFDYSKCKSFDSMRKKMFTYKRENKPIFGIYADELFGVLTLKEAIEVKDSHEVKQRFDSFIADDLILKQLLKLEDDSVQYSSCATKAKEAVDNGDGCLALFLNPPRMSDFIDLVDSGESGIKKAAMIFPRPVDGLVFYSVVK